MYDFIHFFMTWLWTVQQTFYVGPKLSRNVHQPNIYCRFLLSIYLKMSSKTSQKLSNATCFSYFVFIFMPSVWLWLTFCCASACAYVCCYICYRATQAAMYAGGRIQVLLTVQLNHWHDPLTLIATPWFPVFLQYYMCSHAAPVNGHSLFFILWPVPSSPALSPISLSCLPPFSILLTI